MPAGHLPVRSYLAIPVVSRDGQTLGGLFFGHPDPGVFTERAERVASGIAGWAAVAMDNARLYEAERRARAEAEAANRTKSDFLATMSHELRTPLNAMLGYTDLWLLGLPAPLPEPMVPQVDRLRLSARHLLELIEEILTFSRIEAAQETVELEPISIRHLIESAASLVEPLALSAGLTFDIRYPAVDQQADTDPRKVRQILINLLSNAVKFTEQGGVSLEARVEDEQMICAVHDTGDGISASDLEHVFDPFWQAPQSRGQRPAGTGLGLAVSRRLAHLLGGDLSVESEPGRGSVFVLELPLRPPQPEDAPAPSEPLP